MHKFRESVILADMQVSPHKSSRQLLQAIAPAGNIFLLVTLPELRRQGLTFLAFYTLQRIIDRSELPEHAIRIETGLEDYEVSRACRLLVRSDLATMTKSNVDRRVRWLEPTPRGRRIHDKILLAAAQRMQQGVPASGRQRRFSESAESFRQGIQILRGAFQVSFFDRDRLAEEPWERPRKKPKISETPSGRSKSSKA
jgi:DNA-binding MarR family transcriptional regulator